MNNLEKIVLVAVILILTVGGGFIIFAQDSKREPIKETSSMSHDMSANSGEGNQIEPSDFTGESKVMIDIDDSGYEMPSIKIKQNTTVVWTNVDKTEHTIMSGRMDDTQAHSNSSDAADLTSPVLKMNDSYSYIFKNDGIFSYHCSMHPSKTGEIIVTLLE